MPNLLISLYLCCFILLLLPSHILTCKQTTKHKPNQMTSEDDLNFYANTLSDEDNFAANLDAILIPRTVGSANHAKVREHLTRTMSNHGWAVETHSFQTNTPHGEKQFTNVIATLDPAAPRRLVIACHYDTKI